MVLTKACCVFGRLLTMTFLNNLFCNFLLKNFHLWINFWWGIAIARRLPVNNRCTFSYYFIFIILICMAPEFLNINQLYYRNSLKKLLIFSIITKILDVLKFGNCLLIHVNMFWMTPSTDLERLHPLYAIIVIKNKKYTREMFEDRAFQKTVRNHPNNKCWEKSNLPTFHRC